MSAIAPIPTGGDSPLAARLCATRRRASLQARARRRRPRTAGSIEMSVAARQRVPRLVQAGFAKPVEEMIPVDGVSIPVGAHPSEVERVGGRSFTILT